VCAPRLIAHSREVASLLGIDAADVASPAFAQVFAGNALLDGMQPYRPTTAGTSSANGPGSSVTACGVLLNSQVEIIIGHGLDLVQFDFFTRASRSVRD
jgi:hypothetical protein